jgi:hypothetical protein
MSHTGVRSTFSPLYALTRISASPFAFVPLFVLEAVCWSTDMDNLPTLNFGDAKLKPAATVAAIKTPITTIRELSIFLRD